MDLSDPVTLADGAILGNKVNVRVVVPGVLVTPVVRVELTRKSSILLTVRPSVLRLLGAGLSAMYDCFK